MTDLLPCPFCGGKPEPRTNSSGRKFVRCMGCFARGPAWKEEQKASDAWNARTVPHMPVYGSRPADEG